MKWLAVHVGGQRFRVHLVPPDHPALEGENYGSTDHAKSEIFVERRLSQSATEDTLLHELLHAAMDVSGATHVLNDDRDVEEAVVRALTPVLHRLLLDLGFSFPRVPK